MNVEAVYQHFYRVGRLAAEELSDGGGPFGFDITTALEVDWLIETYGCDALFETGCNMGDTTAYLCRRYPALPLFSCDVKPQYVEATRRRVSGRSNAFVEELDSPELIARHAGDFRFPFFYLDAHWYEDWPLERELARIERGVVMVDDFDIGHPRFGFDEYQGQRCGPELLARFRAKISRYYTNNPDALYEFPCLQTGRRGGKAYFLVGEERDYLRHCRYFLRREFAP
ncbi:MAG TPA: hypothetical protein VFX38_03715 [Gammaproteobacteria bacterium]|nr:hypothetical protein [Gammaproteobacteria bacterium]